MNDLDGGAARLSPIQRLLARGLGICAAAMLLFLVCPSLGQASTFTVNNTGDAVDANPGNGACATAGSVCTLRAAIMEANALAGADTITFAAGTNGAPFTLSLTGSEAVTGDAAINDLDVFQDLTITGNGPANTIIQAGASAAAGIDRVFELGILGTAQVDVAMSGLTIRHGKSNNGFGAGISFWGCSNKPTCDGTNQGTLTLDNVHVVNNLEQSAGANGFGGGGGILIEQAHLTISNSTISNNEATLGWGGGIAITGNDSTLDISNSTIANNQSPARMGGGISYIRDGDVTETFTITGSTISGNSAGGRGGGLYIELRNNTHLTITDTTISGNASTQSGANSGGGGGIWTSVPTGFQTTLERVTISGNTVGNGADPQFGGGGMHHGGGTLTLKNSTISGNRSAFRGGGLVLSDNGQTATLTNVTITDNHSDNNNSGGETGGGLYVEEANGAVTTATVLHNTIVAKNYRGSGTGTADDGAGTGAISAASSHNLFGTGGSGTLSGGTGNQYNVADPRLGPLADNGGSTQTHALLKGSPALDAGNNTQAANAGLTSDQRSTGYVRTLDAADAGATDEVDIGAYEAHPTVQDIPDQTTDEDVALPTVTFHVGDDDLAFDSLTATSSNQVLVPNANVLLSGSGSSRTLDITPVANLFGSTTITVTVTDTIAGTVYSMTDTFVLTVNPVADPPSITSATTAEDTQTASGLDITRNAVDGAEVTHFRITGITGGQLFQNNGTIQINSGDFITAAQGAAGLKFTPSANLNSPAGDTFSFTAAGAVDNAGTGLGAGTTVTITVTEVNDPPAGTDDSLASVAEDSGARTIPFAGLLGNDSAGPANESGQALTITAVSSPTGGSVSIVGADVIFTPAADFNGTAGFTYTVQDDGTTNGSDDFRTDTAAVTFTVTEVNDPPAGVDDTLADVAEDAGPQTISFASLLANDGKGPANESGQALTITAVSNPAGGTVSIAGTDVIFTPAADYFGPAGFTYTLEDNGTTGGVDDFLTDTAGVTVTITPVAEAPAVTAATTAEDTQTTSGLVITRSATDGAEVTHFHITGITGGALYQNDGTTAISPGDFITAAQGAAGLRFTPAADQNTPGGDSLGFTVQAATDNAGSGLSPGTLASITVSEVNDPPAAGDDTPGSVAEDSGDRTILFAALLGNDAPGPANESGQTLTITGVTDAVGGTVSIVGTDVIFALAADFNGTASFTYTVEDNGTTGGADDFQPDSASVSFTVTEVNDPVIGVDDSLADVQENAGPQTIPFADLVANDSKGPANEIGQTLTITAVSSPTGGTVSISGTDVIFTPTTDYDGPAGFTYTLQDDGTTNGSDDFQTDTAAATFTILPASEPPSITPATTAEDTQTTSGLVITRNAADGDEVTHFRITGITGGMLYQNDGTTAISDGEFITAAQTTAGLKFTPAADRNSPAGDIFTFTAQAAEDNTGTGLGSGTAAVITVTEANDPPVAADDLLSAVAEDSGARTIAAAGLLANDAAGPANEAGQTLAITAVSDPVGGTVIIDGANPVFTPDADFHGTAGFTYTVSDDGTSAGAADPRTDTASVSFTVTPVADTPSVTNASTLKNAQTTSGLVVSRHPADGAEVTHFQITGITGGSLYQNDGTTAIADGEFITYAQASAGLRFTPTPDSTATGHFTVQASLAADNAGLGGDTVTADITVLTVPDLALGKDDGSLVAIPGATVTYALTYENMGDLDATGVVITETVPDHTSFHAGASTAGWVCTPDGSAGSTCTLALGTVTGGTLGDVAFAVTVDDPLADGVTEVSNTASIADDGSQGPDPTPADNTATDTTAVNPHAPAAADDAYETDEDTPLSVPAPGVLANDSDPDGDPMTAAQETGPAHGTLSLAGDGSFAYTPAADFNGTDTFQYRASDGQLTGNAATVTITVHPVNDPPVALNGALTAVAGEPKAGALAATDVDGDDVTFAIAANPGKGSVTVDDPDAGAFTYTPDAGATGSDSFTFRANDGTADSAPATITIAITAAPNVAPVAADAAYDTEEDIPLSVAAPGVLDHVTDANGDPLTAELVQGPAHGSLTLSPDGSFSYTPHDDFHGADTFRYRAGDGLANSNVATVTLTVTPVNDVPAALDGAAATTAGGTVAGALVAVDADGDDLTYSIVDLPTQAAVTLDDAATGAFTYTADPGATGTDSFTFQASDGTDDSHTATVTVTITASANGAPTVADTAYATAEETPLAEPAPGVLTGSSDPDGDGLTAELVQGPAHGGLTLNAGGSFTYTPDAGFAGSDAFRYRASDGLSHSNVATATITVTPDNDAPTALDGVLSAVAAKATLGTLAAADPDGDTLTFSVVDAPTQGTVTITDAATGAYTYAADADAGGTDSFTFQANDGTVDSNVATVTVTITANSPPVANDDGYTTAEDTGLTVAAPGVLQNDVDADGDLLAAVLDAGAGHGDLALNEDGSFTYDPDANFHGTDQFTYRATAGSAESNLVTVTITVTSVNDAPVAQDGTLAATAGDPAEGTLHAGDADGDALTYSVVTPPVKGSLVFTDAATGAFTYTPRSSRRGQDTFTFKASDGMADSAPATVVITIANDSGGGGGPVNQPPVAAGDSYTADQDTPLSVPAPGVLGNDTDANGDRLEASEVAAPAHGTLHLSEDGSFTYTPDAGFSGTDQFTYRAHDQLTASNAATVRITVRPAPDTTPPQWPVGARMTVADIGATGLVLTWPAASDDTGVVSYRVTGNGGVLGHVSGTVFAVTGLTPGTVYTFGVEAVDAAGNWSSSGPTAQATTLEEGGPPPLPTCPANVCTDVSPTGDTVVEHPGHLQIDIPAGAVQGTDVEIRITTLTGADAAGLLQGIKAPPGFTALGKVFEIEAVGGTVTGPVTLRIPLGANELAAIDDSNKVGLFRLNPDGTLAFAGGKVADGNLVVVLHGFSRYVLGHVHITFSDMAGHWAQGDVELMAAKYVVQGLPDGRFDPGAPVTRAQFAAMLVRAMGLNTSAAAAGSGMIFTDVRTGDWYYGEVMAAVSAGIVQGMGDGTFAPNAPVTREQVAAMVMRAMRRSGRGATLTGGQAQETLAPFADSRAVSAWAVPDVAAAVQAGIIRGDTGGALAPGARASRAEAATIIARFWRD